MGVDLYRTSTGRELQVNLGEVGQRFNYEVAKPTDPFNMTGATRIQAFFKDPADAVLTFDAVEVNPPSGAQRSFTDRFGNDIILNVQIEYTVVSDIFTTAGVWSTWVEIEAPTYNHIGTATEFSVFAPGTV